MVFVEIMKITGSVLIADVKKSFVSIRFVYLQISDTHVSSTLQKYSFREIKKKSATVIAKYSLSINLISIKN